MSRLTLMRSSIFASLLLVGGSVQAQNCDYFLGYIADEAERPFAVKKVYQYTPERIEKILSLRDKGAKLCNNGQQAEGVKVLLEAVKLINFTRLR